MRLTVAAEDHFALVDLSGPEDDVLPALDVMDDIAATAKLLNRNWRFLWDLRGLSSHVYNDTIDAFRAVWDETGSAGNTPTVLVPPGRAEEVQKSLRPLRVEPIELHSKNVPHADVDLSPFDEDVFVADSFYSLSHGTVAQPSPIGVLTDIAGDPAQWSPAISDLRSKRWFADLVTKNVFDAAICARKMIALDGALRGATANSILTQLAIYESQGVVHVTPYHSGGTHHVFAGRDDMVLLRPARVNRRYWATFAAAIAELGALLNRKDVKEAELEDLFKRNPLFLNSLGYERVFHQVALPRGPAPSLIPDVIAEPAGSEWSEILDFKRPSASVLVGGRNRPAMSHALVEAVAQLREYSAYFDDRVAARLVETKLGFKCYRPKLTVVIGRDPTRFSAEEQRRALTAHPDLRVVTYDDVMRAAKTRLLL